MGLSTSKKTGQKGRSSYFGVFVDEVFRFCTRGAGGKGENRTHTNGFADRLITTIYLPMKVFFFTSLSVLAKYIKPSSRDGLFGVTLRHVTVTIGLYSVRLITISTHTLHVEGDNAGST